MKVHGLVVLLASLAALSLSANGCADSGDDDDDGFNQRTLVSIAITGGNTVAIASTLPLTATATYDDATTENVTTSAVWVSGTAGVATVGGNTGLVTGISTGGTTITATVGAIFDTHTVTVTPAVAPGPAITQISSFPAASGTEMWLCFDHQFNGTIDTIFSSDGVGCEATVNPGVASVVDQPTRGLLLIEGLTGCDAGNQSWEFDYTDADDTRCPQGCVKEYDFTLAADDGFGAYCGPGTAVPLSGLSAIFENTTQLPRFTVTAGITGEAIIEKMRVYSNNGVALLSDCTATVTLTSGGTGSFDPACTPDLALVDATTYSSIIIGKVSGIGFSGRLDFVYESTP